MFRRDSKELVEWARVSSGDAWISEMRRVVVVIRSSILPDTCVK
jgi:hypothetical protein